MKTIQDADALLTYKIGPVYCCSPTISVEAVIMPPPLHHPPGTNKTERGFFKHTTGLVKVVDLRSRFGLPQQYWQQPGKIIVVEVESGRTGFWVDEILDVIEFPKQGWKPLGVLVARQVFSRALLLNDVIHLYADFEKLDSFRNTGYLREHIQTLIEKNIAEEGVGDQKTNLYTNKNESKTISEIDNKKNTDIVKESYLTNVSESEIIKPADNIYEEKIKTTQHKNVTESLSLKDDIIKSIPVNLADVKITHNTANKIKPVKPVLKDKNLSVQKKTDEDSEMQLGRYFNRERDSESVNAKNPASVDYEIKNKKETNKALLTTVLLPMSFGFVLLFGAGYLLWPKDVMVNSNDVVVYKNNSISNLLVNEGESVKNKQNQHLFTESKPVIHKEIVVQDEVEPDVFKVEAESVYQAKIEKDDLGITIVLTENISSDYGNNLHEADEIKLVTMPVEAAQEKNEPQQAEAEAEVGLKGNVSSIEIARSEIKKSLKPIKSKVLITHIVVKGDTLWYIAKKYVKNPFKYAELARLSKIKNPDLIYPGDRVRIVRIINKK